MSLWLFLSTVTSKWFCNDCSILFYCVPPAVPTAISCSSLSYYLPPLVISWLRVPPLGLPFCLVLSCFWGFSCLKSSCSVLITKLIYILSICREKQSYSWQFLSSSPTALPSTASNGRFSSNGGEPCDKDYLNADRMCYLSHSLAQSTQAT